MAGPQRITVLQHISYETPEGEKWQVNDVAKISTKLLMSSFYASVDNKLHVSIYSAQWQEVKEKRNIEVSTHTEPHSVLINKDGTILVACVGMNIHFYQAHNVQLQKTVTLEKEPSCTCIGEEGLLVATDNSSTIQIFNFEAIQTKKVVLEGLDQSDFPSDMTMVGDVIYLCTQKNGQALSYDQHGVKLSAFKSNDEQNYKANSIAVHQEKELVFILWNKCNVLVYSHLSNESLFSVDTTCATKVRLIDDYMMILIVPEKNEILVNDAETLIDFAVLKKQFLATLEEKVRNDILLDSKQHESRQGQSSPKSPNSAVPLFSHNYSIQRSKILQQHLLRTFDVAQEQYANYYAKQETTGRLSTEPQTDTPIDFAILKEDFLATLEEKVRNQILTGSKSHESRQSQSSTKSSYSDESTFKRTLSFRKKKYFQEQEMLHLLNKLQIKYDIYKAHIETDAKRLHEIKTVVTNLKEVEERNTKLEEEVTQLQERLLAEERTAKELQTSYLKGSYESGNKGCITKDTIAVSTDDMMSGLRRLIDMINHTMELTKKMNDVTEELQITQKTLTMKELDLSKIQVELDAAISEKKDLEKTVKKTDELYQIIETKEREVQQLRMRLKKAQTEMENAKTQITILQDRKDELEKYLSREQDNSQEPERLFTNLADANNRLKIEYNKAEKRQTLLSDILESLDRDALILKTESEKFKEILQTEQKHRNLTVCLQSEFISRIEKLEKEAEILQFTMGQQNKITDFEKKNRRTLPGTMEQSSTDKDKQKMGLQHKTLPDNENTLDKEIPLGAKRLPEDEQMLETRKEGVTEMTSFQAGKYQLLDEIQDFKVTKEERQLSLIENQLQGIQHKMKYERLQDEYFRNMFESSEKLQQVLRQSPLLEKVDAIVEKISNGKDKLRKLKDNRDKTVEESEVQRDWFEPSELQVSVVVSQDGGKLKIPGSDVSLDIPPGALQEEREIQMKIIPHCLDPGGDPLSFSSNSSVVVELLPNNLQFQRTVHLRLPHCLHLNDNYNSLQDAEVLISHHEKGDRPKLDVSTDTACTLQKDHCVIPLKQFCWITYRVDDKVVTAKRLKIFTAGRDLELSDRESEVEVGYFPDLPGSGEILRNNPKLSRGQIKPFLFQKNEEESTLLISLQQVIPTEWQNNIELGDQQIISYQSICTGTEMSCPFHLQYTPEGSPSGKVPLCLFHITQKNAEQIHITFRPEVKCDED